MSDKKFIRALIIIAAVGMLITAAHAIYVYKAYQKSSIIYFISQELWP
ncbi:hypothetical protein [Butyrivibrio sp. MC2013]|nr:hypothetical protein [Butyrivibrio sp. MC2013]